MSRLSRDATLLADLARRLADTTPHALARAADDSDGHLRSPTLGAARGTGPADPTAREACGSPDPVVHDVALLAAHTRRALHDVRQALTHAQRLTGLPETAAQAIAAQQPATPGGICANPACARWVAGGTHDPIRSGRCGACAEFRRRTGRERPHELAAADHHHPADCPACRHITDPRRSSR